MSVRHQGKKLIFYDLIGNNTKIQVLVNKQFYKGDFELDNENIKRGDIIGISGLPSRSNTG